MVLIQKSFSGDNFTFPTYSITWNGLTFSTRVASGCSNQPIESYFRVTTFPVFWIFGSNNSKLVVKSKSSSEISDEGKTLCLSELERSLGLN